MPDNNQMLTIGSDDELYIGSKRILTVSDGQEIHIGDKSSHLSSIFDRTSGELSDKATDIFESASRRLLQSPYLVLQAAGSDGSDNTTKGVHLRWDFRGTLRNNHIPKGNLAESAPYNTSSVFNKTNDFVELYKVPYNHKYLASVDLRTTFPDRISTEDGKRIWEFDTRVKTSIGDIISTIFINFQDIQQYDYVEKRYFFDPNYPRHTPAVFLSRYQGVVLAGVKNKLSFSASLQMQVQSTKLDRQTRIEVISDLKNNSGISTPNEFNSSELNISCRKTFTNYPGSASPDYVDDSEIPITANTAFLKQDDVQEHRMVNENIVYIRFDYKNVGPAKLYFETYYDFITATNNDSEQPWEKLTDASEKDFALSIDDTEVFNRLDNAAFDIHGNWPRFKGNYCVDTNNYKDKWNAQLPATKDRIKQGVLTYLEHSTESNPKANLEYNADSESTVSDPEKVEVSFLDLLKLVTTDFHIARMLGFGHIDAMPDTSNKQQFIYMIKYHTAVTIEENDVISDTEHVYMYLPTSKSDYRLPMVPELQDVGYGMRIPAEPVNLMLANETHLNPDRNDEQTVGYSQIEDIRFVRLYRKNILKELTYSDIFFKDDDEFCDGAVTETAFFGLTKRTEAEGQSSPQDWHYNRVVDPTYNGESGRSEEILPLMNYSEPVNVDPLDARSIYIDREDETGIHEYSLYAINCFSRVSNIAPLKNTDYTYFEIRNTLLPPANFVVQLIQQEDPLILTTQAEQDMLAGLTNPPDYTEILVRATFQWNHAHNMLYQYNEDTQQFKLQADKVKLLYKVDEPLMSRGKITSVSNQVADTCKITIGAYNDASLSSAQMSAPNITPANKDIYIGGALVSEEVKYKIKDIIIGSSETEIILECPSVRSTEALTASGARNEFKTIIDYFYPQTDTFFSIVENISSLDQWPLELTQEVTIKNFETTLNEDGSSAPSPQFHRETYIDGNGEPYRLNIGGVFEKATVEKTSELIRNYTGDFSIPYSETGIYKITFNTYDLPVENDIEWYKGTARIKLNGTTENEKKVLEIQTIDTTKSPLEMYVIDSDFISNESGIVWNLDNVDNVTVNNDKIIKIVETSPDNAWDAGGVSVNSLPAGLTGNAEYIITQETGSIDINDQKKVIGLTFTETYNQKDDIDYGLFFDNGTLRIIESGTVTDLTTPSDTYAINDVFHIVRDAENSKIIYYKNGVEIHQTAISNSGQMWVATSIATNLDYFSNVNTYFPEVGVANADIETGSDILVNFHPGYRVYLTAETGFDKAQILPEKGTNEKLTFMSAYSQDTDKSLKSEISSMAGLYAREIVPPVPPGSPQGPEYATRPDYYGKASYTFDVTVSDNANRSPYSLIFYRSNEQSILDTLYKPSTVQSIRDFISTLSDEHKRFMVDYWKGLVSFEIDSLNNLFRDYFVDNNIPDMTFRFPKPDNEEYARPNADLNAPIEYPFTGGIEPGSNGTIKTVVKEAILGSFLPLTEESVLFLYIKEGFQTRNTPPVTHDRNGIRLNGQSSYDPSPMAVKIMNGSYAEKVRFTDYTLDGSSVSIYFYYGIEMSNELKFSEASPVAGPIALLNAFPAEKPTVKKISSITENIITGDVTSVVIAINGYMPSDRILGLLLYRATNPNDAKSVRTMALAKELKQVYIEGTPQITEITDEFEDLDFPPFGDPIYYRLVALREIEINKVETNPGEFEYEYDDVPSQPSKVALASIVDVKNPPAPEIKYTSGLLRSDGVLPSVKLTWNKTAHNATYYLYKMNSSGNWQAIGEAIDTNDSKIMYVVGELNKQDEDGNTIYHRYKVDVENSSGLFNTEENILVI